MKADRIKLEDLLRQMIGKDFLYNANQVKVLSYNFEGDTCTVATSLRWIKKPSGEMLSLLQDEFMPVDSDEDVADLTDPSTGATPPATTATGRVPAVPAQPFQIHTVDYFKQLTPILMNNIKNVQNSKDYVEQAQQVSLSVKMFVDLAKAEIEAAKVVSELAPR